MKGMKGMKSGQRWLKLGLVVWGMAMAGGQAQEDDQVKALLERGKELLAEGRYDVALQKFQFAVQKAPDSAEGHYHLGRTHLKLGQAAEALAALKKAQELDPTLSFAPKEEFGAALKAAQAAVGEIPPTEIPPVEKPAETPTTVPPAVAAPVAASPETPFPPPTRLYALVGGGAAAVALLSLLVSLINRQRRKNWLHADLVAALALYQQVADELSAAQKALRVKPDRTAASKIEAAELTFFEGVDMLAAARQEETEDLPRVRRARKLFEDAQMELAEGWERLPEPPAEMPTQGVPGAAWACYFCSKPLYDRYDGDIVEIHSGGRQRDALICRKCSRNYRQGNVPNLRVVRQGGQIRHWAESPDYDPIHDFYHDDRHGRELVSLAVLDDALVEARNPYAIYVETDERPDYRLNFEEFRRKAAEDQR